MPSPYHILLQCNFHYITPLQHTPWPLFSLLILLAIQLRFCPHSYPVTPPDTHSLLVLNHIYGSLQSINTCSPSDPHCFRLDSSLLIPLPHSYLILSMAASNPSIHAIQATHTMTPLLLTHLTSHPIVNSQKGITFIQILTWLPSWHPFPTCTQSYP